MKWKPSAKTSTTEKTDEEKHTSGSGRGLQATGVPTARAQCLTSLMGGLFAKLSRPKV